MEVKDWAEKILFGATLNDKLYQAPPLSDDKPLSSYELPQSPARDGSLKFAQYKKKFPALNHLEKDSVKAEVLHFFANHELLALELMALALLRFPNSPKAFRKGLVQAMREEQEHMHFYLDHMRRYGLEFGEKPLSDFFWKTLHKVDSPYDFICNMSLCLEQANLDYSLYFQKAFQEVGDQEISNVLHQVYVDEIRHVAFGYHWFQKWRPKGDEFKVHQKSLVKPLTMRRAKGKVLDRKGREKIGFSKDYIDRLEVFESSRGKIPKLLRFNPDSELKIKDKRTHSAAEDLKNDLAYLMFFLADESDLLLAKSLPSKDFLLQWKEIGFPICEIENKRPKERKFQDHPWAKEDPWLLSKDRTKEFLDLFYSDEKKDDIYLPREQLLNEKKDIKIEPLIAKPRFGASGRGIHFHHKKALAVDEKDFLFEKRLQLKTNLSFHFQYHDGRARFLGWTEFDTNSFGTFLKSHLGKKDFPLNPFLKKDNSFYQDLKASYKTTLEKLIGSTYQGPISLDAMIVEEEGEVFFHPCNDLNIRYSMGRIAWEIKKYLDPKTEAIFENLSFSSQNKLKNFVEEHPSYYKLNKSGLIKDVNFYFGEPSLARRFLARLTSKRAN